MLLQMESPLEFMVHLALEMTRKGSYPHEYKRERDFNLESACMHFVSLNQCLSDALGTSQVDSAHIKRIPCIPYLQQMSMLHSQLLVSLQQVLVYV